MVDWEKDSSLQSIWKSLDKLRPDLMERWYFNHYILGFLFYKYISEDFSNYVKLRANAGDDFDYSTRKDDEPWLKGLENDFIEDKGYFIPPSHLFQNVLKKITSGAPEHSEFRNNLNEKIKEIFMGIESTTHDSESKGNFKGLFRMLDLNSTLLGDQVIQRNRVIVQIITEIEKIKEIVTKEGDCFPYGYVYECLIRRNASKEGKKGGDSYTPPEVSELLVDLASEGRKDKVHKIYDPACGSGSLLLKFLKKDFEQAENFRFFGQEIKVATYDICRMNMFLNGVNYSQFDIRREDTLKNDEFKGVEFDTIVSNPSHSKKWVGKSDVNLRNDERFAPAGALAPKSHSDMAFIQHALHHLSNDGVATMACFPGIFYRDNRSETNIRKWLVNGNYIDSIIQLPNKLFYGTTVDACIMTLKKTKETNDILFIDASTFFTQAKKQNKLGVNDREKIMQLYRDRKDVDEYARVVGIEEIKQQGGNDYNLSVSSYVSKKPKEGQIKDIDIDALEEEMRTKTIRINMLKQKIDDLVKQIREGKSLAIEAEKNILDERK